MGPTCKDSPSPHQLSFSPFAHRQTLHHHLLSHVSRSVPSQLWNMKIWAFFNPFAPTKCAHVHLHCIQITGCLMARCVAILHWSQILRTQICWFFVSKGVFVAPRINNPMHPRLGIQVSWFFLWWRLPVGRNQAWSPGQTSSSASTILTSSSVSILMTIYIRHPQHPSHVCKGFSFRIRTGGRFTG